MARVLKSRARTEMWLTYISCALWILFDFMMVNAPSKYAADVIYSICLLIVSAMAAFYYLSALHLHKDRLLLIEKIPPALPFVFWVIATPYRSTTLTQFGFQAAYTVWDRLWCLSLGIVGIGAYHTFLTFKQSRKEIYRTKLIMLIGGVIAVLVLGLASTLVPPTKIPIVAAPLCGIILLFLYPLLFI